jgi:hypothetical protein
MSKELSPIDSQQADLDDKDSLRVAMKDAYAVFAVTNFHERLSKDYEMQQGINVADVAKVSIR